MGGRSVMPPVGLRFSAATASLANRRGCHGRPSDLAFFPPAWLQGAFDLSGRCRDYILRFLPPHFFAGSAEGASCWVYPAPILSNATHWSTRLPASERRWRQARRHSRSARRCFLEESLNDHLFDLRKLSTRPRLPRGAASICFVISLNRVRVMFSLILVEHGVDLPSQCRKVRIANH